MTSISLENIVDAFVFYKPTLKMQEIKDYIFESRRNSFEGYKSRYSFDQTIQRIVESHCATKKGFNGKPVFESPERGIYQLSNPQYWVDLWQIENVDDKVLKLNLNNQTEDLEVTARTLREINIINRNKNLVQNLKSLYNSTCQICATQIKIADNTFYSEVHHIKSLGQPHNGPDSATNMIVVCPNCHVKLDFKAIDINKNELTIKEPHNVDNMYIEYHNSKRT